MFLTRSLVVAAASLSLLSSARPAEVQKRGIIDALLDPVCVQIANSISSASDVYYPGITHWARSSSQASKCVVEPGTAEDVVLNILGSTQTPFAGGGHASNPGFSSTYGVHISMFRFSEVKYNKDSQTAVIGTGLVWDDVYAALQQHGVTVVGGRVTGVGVAGFILGGGYSWLTNQHGLAVDTLTAFELVKPDGSVVTVTETSEPDLFWGLKGGFNNFGIVTKFTMKTYAQPEVWGGLITITEKNIPLVAETTAKFSANVKNPKAGIITIYNYLLGQPGISQILFYDGPSPPAGIFDDFLSIPYFTKDVKARSLSSLVQASPANATYGQRGIFNAVSVLEYTPNLLNVILNETEHLSAKTGVFISYDVQPFLADIYTHNTTASAFPATRPAKGLLPFNIYYAWVGTAFDDDFHAAAKQSAAQIRNAALAEGQALGDSPNRYPNYAIYDTPLPDMYGSSVERLKSLKARRMLWVFLVVSSFKGKEGLIYFSTL